MQKKTKKKILYLCPASNIGGPVISLLDLLQNIDRTKYTPVVLVLNNACFEYLDELKQLEVDIIKSDIYIHNWLILSENKISFGFFFRYLFRFWRSFYNAFIIRKIIKKKLH